MQKKDWHALTVEQSLDAVDAGRDGLSAEQAQERLREFGPNRLRPPHRRGPFMRFVAQLHNVLIYVLLVAAVFAVLLRDYLDAGVILGVVFVNTLIGFIQEGKAEKALDAIRDMLSPSATALRDGSRTTVPAEELVPGDVVLLQAGDKVSADIRLIEIHNLQIDEAILTGESVPVAKQSDPVEEEAGVGDRLCMAYSGTLVTQGQGTGVVVRTGEWTEIGRISEMLTEVQTLTTPLLRQIAQFSRWLTAAILVLAGFTFAYGYFVQGFLWQDMFATAVGLAVAAIPEGLPAVMTITLAIGVQRMVRRNAIIRRLPAVETLGSVTTICSDKTGTLTRNEMTAKVVVTADAEYEVSGVGYAPKGDLLRDGEKVDSAEVPALHEFLRAGLLCNEAAVREVDGSWRLEGAPTEGALVVLGMKAGYDVDGEQKEYPRSGVIPFDSAYKYMATLHETPDGSRVIYMKGAPDRLLEFCTDQQSADGPQPLDKARWEQRLEEIASQGQRLLAIACRSVPAGKADLDHADVEQEMTLLGVCGIIDPPRQEAIDAVRECHEAGINVKMITGDYAITAQAIAEELGIGEGKEPVDGAELEQTGDEKLRTVVMETDVFARSSPEHKLRLVRALQANNQVVAMTGDGVNDAPALKQADVGVAMGQKGTDVAQEASEMVLTDDNFRSIVNAVEEGRAVYDNLKKTIMFILPVNGGESLMMVVAVVLAIGAMVMPDGLMHFNLPITPVQILWVNMMSSVLLALALAFEPKEPGVMQRPPRTPGMPILSGFLIWRIGFVSLILVAGAMSHFQYMLLLWPDLDQAARLALARTAAVNTLVFGEIAYLFNSRYFTASSFRKESILGNRFALVSVGLLIVIQIFFTYAWPVQLLFGTAALDAWAWLRILAFAALVFVLVEGEKAVHRSMERGPS
ncbi:MAG: cation-transporting P-type ATPase [Thermoguttaceae bacterium]|jgi:magnesium-transporting ATPase (P-type)|nr:cation-transporting P-type ATPase [Thermoguttaceae bacterium]